MARPRKTKVEKVVEDEQVETSVEISGSVEEVANKDGLDLEAISITPVEPSYYNATISDLYLGAILEGRSHLGNHWLASEITEDYFTGYQGNTAFNNMVNNLLQSPHFYRIKTIDDDDMYSMSFSKEKTGVYTRYNCTVVIDLNKSERNTQIYIDDKCMFNGFIKNKAEMNRTLKMIL